LEESKSKTETGENREINDPKNDITDHETDRQGDQRQKNKQRFEASGCCLAEKKDGPAQRPQHAGGEKISRSEPGQQTHRSEAAEANPGKVPELAFIRFPIELDHCRLVERKPGKVFISPDF